MEPNSTQQHSTSGTFGADGSEKAPVSERKPAATGDHELATDGGEVVEEPSDDYDAEGFVIASDYRVAVLEELARGPGVPSKLAERTGFEIAHVSRTLGKLRERGLVELLVPESRKKGRIYGISDDGRAVHERVQELQEAEA